mmetsp:Transcript_119196/g.273310  ORF Transcript_119196/g.273310 Transcript_119196/m.273310 type:complete len:101 (-) Transcript_119196:145-447(-)
MRGFEVLVYLAACVAVLSDAATPGRRQRGRPSQIYWGDDGAESVEDAPRKIWQNRRPSSWYPSGCSPRRSEYVASVLDEARLHVQRELDGVGFNIRSGSL